MKRTLVVSIVGLCCLSVAWAQEAPNLWFTSEHATAKLLILGMFHFKDAGLDGYKPEVDVDILSEPRQAELKDVLDRLEKFAPTKILIEVKAERAEVIDERYRQYLAGDFELEANEIYQVAFRLAKQSSSSPGHTSRACRAISDSA